MNFNPRTPCGVRPPALRVLLPRELFQSTHPVRGATAVSQPDGSFQTLFQSTHPVRGATVFGKDNKPCFSISIHAPRAGCDPLRFVSHSMFSYFNPRTPCGVRLQTIKCIGVRRDFNPRTPCGVRRICFVSFKRYSQISIHAPRAGCDFFEKPIRSTGRNFNPRTPCGVRRI